MASSGASSAEVVWAVETAPNPAVVRVHTMLELTKRTIVTCPPAGADPPLDLLLLVPGIRSLDLHRYRVRVNLEPDADAQAAATAVIGALMPAWGRPATLPPEDPAPRAFPIWHGGPRRVAESLEMAGDHARLASLFRVHGVAEAIEEPGRVLVRPGRLFAWDRVEPGVRAALTGD